MYYAQHSYPNETTRARKLRAKSWPPHRSPRVLSRSSSHRPDGGAPTRNRARQKKEGGRNTRGPSRIFSLLPHPPLALLCQRPRREGQRKKQTRFPTRNIFAFFRFFFSALLPRRVVVDQTGARGLIESAEYYRPAGDRAPLPLTTIIIIIIITTRTRPLLLSAAKKPGHSIPAGVPHSCAGTRGGWARRGDNEAHVSRSPDISR